MGEYDRPFYSYECILFYYIYSYWDTKGGSGFLGSLIIEDSPKDPSLSSIIFFSDWYFW